MYDVPILFVFFNRIDIALKSFDIVTKIKPKSLYLASDAAREYVDGEQDTVSFLRKELVHRIDWECDVHTLYQTKNLGCGLGVYSAINWFFNNVEYGIILEDDCVVNASFFQFMEELLIKYKEDTRIGMIAGTNPLVEFDAQTTYIFSKYKSCWGWASWCRAWKNMDLEMSWRGENYESVLRNAGYCAWDYKGWKYKINCIDKNIVSAWDWQWYFSLSAQNQLCIYPIKNLVSNIGTDENATHTSGSDITLKSFMLDFPLKHPKIVVPDCQFDKLFYKDSNTFMIKLKRMIPFSLKRKIKKIIVKFNKD